jgi:hypothetical protein
MEPEAWASLAASPLACAVLLYATGGKVELALTLHQCLAGLFWGSFFFLTDEASTETTSGSRALYEVFVLGSVAIFASEIALLLLPLHRGGDGKLDSALFIHHVGVFSMMLTGYVIADGNAHALRGGATILALAAPSYTCVPKALRAASAPKLLVDVVWVAALSVWVFWRVPRLVHDYGVGFDRLRVLPLSPDYWTCGGAGGPEGLAPSSLYYTSVVITTTLFVIFLVNLYWCWGKLVSITRTLAPALGIEPPADMGSSSTPAAATGSSIMSSTHRTAPAYHGGRSWDTTGFDFEAREKFVVADVLDAPFPPSPNCLKILQDPKVLSAAVRESPPTNCEPVIEAISRTRGVAPEHLLASSGSSSLIFSLFPQLLRAASRVLILSPTYSEYGHALRVLCGIPEGGWGKTLFCDAILY